MESRNIQHPKFDQALAALDRGDIKELEVLLDAHPDLVHAVSHSEDGCYAGYFYRPTLLHHVAGNPTRGPIPTKVLAVTKLLLDKGADVDAFCGGGPAQPSSGGATVLGLVASGASAQVAGHSYELLDLLIERGATMDFVGDGGLMWISLYHTVENKNQILVAEHLAKHGHSLDMCFAAGLGEIEFLKSYLSKDGSIKQGADYLYRNHTPLPASDDQDIWQDILLFASICGKESIARLALASGAKIDQFRYWGPRERVTPLHATAWAGRPEMARLLLDFGANSALKDPLHKSTPLDWARHCKRDETAKIISKHIK